MRKVKFIAILLIFIIIFSTLTGCSVKKYNAVLYERAKDWVDEDFLDKNRVKGYYKNKDYIEGVSEWGDRYIRDRESPGSRIFVITTKEEFDEIFTECPHSVEFDKEIVILYIASSANTRDYHLRKIELNDKVLTIQIEMERNFKLDSVDDSVMLYQRCMMIKMNKIEIDEVKIKEM